MNVEDQENAAAVESNLPQSPPQEVTPVAAPTSEFQSEAEAAPAESANATEEDVGPTEPQVDEEPVVAAEASPADESESTASKMQQPEGEEANAEEGVDGIRTGEQEGEASPATEADGKGEAQQGVDAAADEEAQDGAEVETANATVLQGEEVEETAGGAPELSPDAEKAETATNEPVDAAAADAADGAATATEEATAEGHETSESAPQGDVEEEQQQQQQQQAAETTEVEAAAVPVENAIEVKEDAQKSEEGKASHENADGETAVLDAKVDGEHPADNSTDAADTAVTGAPAPTEKTAERVEKTKKHAPIAAAVPTSRPDTKKEVKGEARETELPQHAQTFNTSYPSFVRSRSRSPTIVHDSTPTAEEILLAQMAAEENSSHVLTAFRRGNDNSHVNRMQEGSYSRYLQSTRTVMEPQRLVDSFFGTAPTIGTVPRNVVAARAPSPASRERSESFSGATATSQSLGYGGTNSFTGGNPNATFSTSLRAAAGRSVGLSRFGHNGAATADMNPNSTMASTFNATARSTSSGGTMLRREVALLSDDVYNELVAQRDRMRHTFRRGKPTDPKKQLDYVYYNHKSKGYYVPQPNPDEALLLQYNHLYSYGPDGTRMLSSRAGGGPSPANAARATGVPNDAENGVQQSPCLPNPYARPPKTFGETRGLSWKLRSGAYTTGSGQGTGGVAAQQQQQQQQHHLPPSASSLRTAKAIDVATLRGSQRCHNRSIEDVLSCNPIAVQKTREGLAAAIQTGKLKEEDVPSALKQQQPRSADKTAINEPRSVTFSADAYNGGRADGMNGGGQGAAHVDSMTNQSLGAEGPLLPQLSSLSAQQQQREKPYEVSRLRFETRHDKERTPSAFVK